MKISYGLLLVCLLALPVVAQSQTISQAEADAFSARGFGFISREQFAAKTTFDAVFGDSFQRMFGGGALLAERGVFLEITASRFKKTGQRAVLLNDQAFGLNIPLTVTLTPLEFAAGYRFRRRTSIIPYVGGGFGSYHYTETSPFSDESENVDLRQVGYLAVGGAEVRVHRWVGVAADVRYTHIPGILGEDGLSKDADEKDLGGVAIGVKVIVGVGR
jgi:opacity protein-like surface antigen